MPDTTEYSANAHVSGTLSVTGSVIVNEHSHPSYDFRIESDGQSHMLFVDAGNDAVGIATDSPNASLSLTVNGDAAFTDDKKLYFGNDADWYIEYDEDGQDRLTFGGSDAAFLSTTSNKPKISLFNYNTDAEGPLLILQKWSQSSAADDDVCGDIQFLGLDDGNAVHTYGQIKVSSADVTGGEEDGRMEINILAAGSSAAVLRLESTKVGVFNSAPTEALDVIGNIRTVKNNNSAGAKGKLILAKSKGSAGSETVVSSGDTIGAIEFNAYDGDEFLTAAEIYAKVDNTPGDGDMPGSLHLAVTADGGDSATDRMIIDSKGNVRVNVDAGGQTLNSSAMGTIALHSGVAPGAGTTNTAVLYTISGELKAMDASGNETVLSPHPEGSEDWVFYSKNVETGKTVKIQMEKLMKKLNDLLGEDLYEEWIEEIT